MWRAPAHLYCATLDEAGRRVSVVLERLGSAGGKCPVETTRHTIVAVQLPGPLDKRPDARRESKVTAILRLVLKLQRHRVVSHNKAHSSKHWNCISYHMSRRFDEECVRLVCRLLKPRVRRFRESVENRSTFTYDRRRCAARYIHLEKLNPKNGLVKEGTQVDLEVELTSL